MTIYFPLSTANKRKVLIPAEIGVGNFNLFHIKKKVNIRFIIGTNQSGTIFNLLNQSSLTNPLSLLTNPNFLNLNLLSSDIFILPRT